jgi:hypothetical protein
MDFLPLPKFPRSQIFVCSHCTSKCFPNFSTTTTLARRIIGVELFICMAMLQHISFSHDDEEQYSYAVEFCAAKL